MATEGITEFVNQQTWLDPISDVLQQAIEQLYAAGGASGRRIEKLLSGTWMGHALHPALTDVPIGAWAAAVALDAIEDTTGSPAFAPGADAAVSIGLAAALAAVVTGLSDWHYATDRPRRLGIAHGLLNLSAVSIYATSLALRRTPATRAWGRRLGYLGFAVTACAGWLGGDLTLGEHLGTNHAPDDTPEEWTSVLPDEQVREGELQLVAVAGTLVMLVRQREQVYALANTCSHLGGPLNEGHLQGDTIVCPWHASRFALADGHVLDGPATFAQPCYQTRLRDGRIEVGPRCVTPALAPTRDTADGRMMLPGDQPADATADTAPRSDSISQGGD